MIIFNTWHSDLDSSLGPRLISVTDAERNGLQPLVTEIMCIATIAPKESILALARRTDRVTDPDLAAALRMLLDGVEPANVVGCIRNRIVYSEIRGVTLLKLLVIGTGILAVTDAASEQFIEEFLGSYLRGKAGRSNGLKNTC